MAPDALAPAPHLKAAVMDAMHVGVAKALAKEALRRVGRAASAEARKRAFQQVRQEFAETIALPQGSARRVAAKASATPMGKAVRQHDKIVREQTRDVAKMRREAGLPVVRGEMSPASVARHLNLRDVRLSVDGRPHGTYRNWAEAQRAAGDVLRERPDAVLSGDAVGSAEATKGSQAGFSKSTQPRKTIVFHEEIAADLGGHGHRDANVAESKPIDDGVYLEPLRLKPAPETKRLRTPWAMTSEGLYWDVPRMHRNDIARLIRDYAVEIFCVIDPKTMHLKYAPKVGEDSTVGLTTSEIQRTYGMIIVHNHPRGSNLSLADIESLCRRGYWALEAIRPDGTIHGLKWKDGATIDVC